MIILKLGGSVITKKDATTPTLDAENLDRICREISESSYGKLIIVHGAGSFGHPYAEKYGIGRKIESQKELAKKRMGFSITQDSVKKLNSVVCDYLRRYGMTPVSIQPSSFIQTENKRIKPPDLQIIKSYLELGLVPVLYGDVVLDRDNSIKMAVLSGDQIIKYLAENLKPRRVILASDVDGIYHQDPKKYPNTPLLEVVTSPDQVEHHKNTSTGDVTDVTGGMVGKLKELIRLADLGIESEIINANHHNLIKKAINGEKITRTLIKKGR